ncbi:hypothetical protein EYF80_048802 [Liparis tanakae]|uniref:Uncharacterized protein n=1 Tax=Liparis tanakae TaxID=230148 RepID=A0A4Z2FJS3_9TELE|nr:hypothetical protein EYF80_048802 [Liparis tanakae]
MRDVLIAANRNGDNAPGEGRRGQRSHEGPIGDDVTRSARSELGRQLTPGGRKERRKRKRPYCEGQMAALQPEL